MSVQLDGGPQIIPRTPLIGRIATVAIVAMIEVVVVAATTTAETTTTTMTTAAMTTATILALAVMAVQVTATEETTNNEGDDHPVQLHCRRHRQAVVAAAATLRIDNGVVRGGDTRAVCSIMVVIVVVFIVMIVEVEILQLLGN